MTKGLFQDLGGKKAKSGKCAVSDCTYEEPEMATVFLVQISQNLPLPMPALAHLSRATVSDGRLYLSHFQNQGRQTWWLTRRLCRH